MREGSYLCSSFHSGYSVEGYVYERDIWLKKGLVLTDDGQALIRTPPRPGLWINENFLRMIDGEQFRKGPWPGEMPSEPLPPPRLLDDMADRDNVFLLVRLLLLRVDDYTPPR